MSKIVRESLNEIISFERGKDPLSSLDIGINIKIKKYLKELFKYDNSGAGYRTINMITIPKDKSSICITCYPGSSVKRYLKDLLKKFNLIYFIIPKSTFNNFGIDHDYYFDIKEEYKDLIKPLIITGDILDESIYFERSKDPLSALGIGRKKLIEDWLKKVGVEIYIINPDLTLLLTRQLSYSRTDDIILNEKEIDKFLQIDWNNIKEQENILSKIDKSGININYFNSEEKSQLITLVCAGKKIKLLEFDKNNYETDKELEMAADIINKKFDTLQTLGWKIWYTDESFSVEICILVK